ncbi:DNA polymerase III, delta subunit [Legionella lansingensis]|uniref:DNA polymerase III subunit delta n=1 Tax=Legionella lansingensis TaxID=45067 RepID=A0A0W0VK03_9GAMM|nr:DNA polymerase III subunit delta [Legionella lansingensis]KTD20434.1 DNA polymerase III, delta subunit [Legionella lansingensis]SNV49981.1 DNA polymerase III, delta subunit [Legionella lansingensis]
MLIKQQTLASYLARHALPAIYILTGQDYFLLSETAKNIKHAWLTQHTEPHETILHINQTADWAQVEEKAYSYNLFAESSLIDIRYEKQTLDNAGKHFLNHYIANSNPCCLIIIRAPNLPAKQLTGFTHHEQIHIVQIFPLDNVATQHWIRDQLQKKKITFESAIPALIQQYTQGNMLACAQALEKIQLIDDGSMLTTAVVESQLTNQCDYQLFELSDACLLPDADKVVLHLRHAYNSGTEATLVLWLLAQDLRNLIQLIELTQQSVSFATACSQLKIWAHRSKLYQSALKRVQKNHLVRLLQFSKKIDERIKSNANGQIWPALEQMALSFCLGIEVGNLA